MDRQTFDHITRKLPVRSSSLVEAAARVVVEGYSVEQSARTGNLPIAELRPVLQDYYAGSGLPSAQGIVRRLVDVCGSGR